MQIRRFKRLVGVIIVTFTVSGVAYAKTKTFTCQSSGTGVSVPVDIDSNSCFTAANGATVCTDTSSYGNVGGNCSPGGSSSTGSNVFEYEPVSGTGCNILGNTVPNTIASCTLANSSEQGCEFRSVAGGAEVDRDNKTLDLLFSTAVVTICLDLSSGSPPHNFTGTYNETITGGTGNNAGATGTGTFTFDGQQLISDAAGNGFSWSEATGSATITTK